MIDCTSPEYVSNTNQHQRTEAFRILDVNLVHKFCGFHIELRSPNPNVESGFLKAELITLHCSLGRDVRIL